MTAKLLVEQSKCIFLFQTGQICNPKETNIQLFFPLRRERLNECSSGDPLSFPPGIKSELIIRRGTNLPSVYINTGRQLGLKWYHYIERTANEQATFADWGPVNAILRVIATLLLMACSHLKGNSILQCHGMLKMHSTDS